MWIANLCSVTLSLSLSLSKEKGIVSRLERYFPLYQMGAGLKGNPPLGGVPLKRVGGWNPAAGV